MNSKTYVNEIDISKVKQGQTAIIEVDAFPNKSFTGVVYEVANMGEQMSNSNAKVFEVIIQVDGYDSVIRPSMTTKNRIITSIIDSVIFLPIECVNVSDSVNFVFTRAGKKQVIPGEINETSIIIHAGLEVGDKVYLIPPEGADEWSLHMLDQDIIDKFKFLDKKTQEASESSNTKRPKRKGKRNFNGKRKK
jgi:hypothetical protein